MVKMWRKAFANYLLTDIKLSKTVMCGFSNVWTFLYWIIFKMVEANSMYPNLNDQQQFVLKKSMKLRTILLQRSEKDE